MKSSKTPLPSLDGENFCAIVVHEAGVRSQLRKLLTQRRMGRKRMPKKKHTTKSSPLLPRRLKRRPRLDPMKALEQFVGSGDAPLELILKIARESDPTRLGFPWEIVNEPPEKERQ